MKLTSDAVNRNMLAALKPMGSSPSTMLTVAKRALNATSGRFMPLMVDSQVVRELPEDRIQIPGMKQLDGQYIILVTDPKPVGQVSIFLRIALEERGTNHSVAPTAVNMTGLSMTGLNIS